MLENLNCQILADSINPVGCRLTTILFKRFPYCLIQEMGTHRMNVASAITPFLQDMSRNSASTRAIPLKKLIEKVKEDPFIPTFELNKRGMSGDPIADDTLLGVVKRQWETDLYDAIDMVSRYEVLGIHKSKPAKLLIPWLRIPIIVSSTNWEHFFGLRISETVDVDFKEHALDAQQLYVNSRPEFLKLGEWHIPFKSTYGGSDLDVRLKASAANVARVSYFNFDGTTNISDNLALAESLIENKHMSPFEHIARSEVTDCRVRNFSGFTQYRVLLEEESEVLIMSRNLDAIEVYRIIPKQPNSISVEAIAKRLGYHKTTIRSKLIELEADELIERTNTDGFEHTYSYRRVVK